MDKMTEPKDTVFGPNFKVRCSICCATSGWKTFEEADAWWHNHHSFTLHHTMAKFIKKFKYKNGSPQ